MAAGHSPSAWDDMAEPGLARMSGRLVGRVDEFASLGELLRRVASGSAASLVISGESGQGKSTLLRVAADEARARGFTVLRATGAEFEWDLPFSGLTSVLRPLLGVMDELPAAQLRALRGALGLEEQASSPVLLVYTATLSLLAAAGEEAPVTVVVDDAQWVDTATLESLVFAAHRCAAERVGFLFAQRQGEPCLLDRVQLPCVDLGGLDREPAVVLLTGQGVDPEVAGRCWSLTGGNPLALLEAARGLSPAQRSGEAPLPIVLPIGPRLLEPFLDRVVDLPEPALVALGAAALEPDGDAAVVIRALGEMGGDLEDLAEAERRGVVTLTSGRVAWSHPLLRAAVFHRLGADRHRRLHRALAGAVTAEGRADRAIWHLAQAATGPDEAIAAHLDAAAAGALQRGARMAAAEAFDEAARLSTQAEDRARRVLAAADARVGAGEYQRVVADLRAAIDGVANEDTRARMGLVLGQSEIWQSGPTAAIRRFEHHATLAAEQAPALSVGLLLNAATARLLTLDTPGAVATADRASAVAAAANDPMAMFGASAIRHITGLFNAEAAAAETALAPIGQLAVAALDTGVAGADELAQLCAYAHEICEDWAAATELLRLVIHASDSSGMVGRSIVARFILADVWWRTGRWSESLAEMTQVISLQEATGLRHLVAGSEALLGRIEAGLGLADLCRVHARHAIELSSRLGVELFRVWALSGLGLLELGARQAVAAADLFDQVAAATRHVTEPGWLWWSADAIEAWALSRNTDKASEAVERLREQAASTGRGWAIAAVQRCDGLLGTGPPEENFTNAVNGFHSVGAPFEEARTLLLRGEHRLRAGQPRDGARDLAAARTIFDRLGARSWSDRASADRGEGGAASIPLASRLTAAELRVAIAVGHGASNREAAEKLFVSVKTVDYHLQNVYRKLGLRSRTQLAALVLSDYTASS
jgi:DNA-binding CsgD family transcriptional regulator